MRYRITLANPINDHRTSQSKTGVELRKAGFTNIKWNMASTIGRDGGSLHRWDADGDDESLLVLKLSADVKKVEEVPT